MNWEGNPTSVNVIDCRQGCIIFYYDSLDPTTLDQLSLAVPAPDYAALADSVNNIAINYPTDLADSIDASLLDGFTLPEIDIPGDWWPEDGIPFGG